MRIRAVAIVETISSMNRFINPTNSKIHRIPPPIDPMDRPIVISRQSHFFLLLQKLIFASVPTYLEKLTNRKI